MSTKKAAAAAAAEEAVPQAGFKVTITEDGQRLRTEGKLIYVGPTLPGIGTTNTIYDNGMPPDVKEKAKTTPAIGRLFLPLKYYPTAEKQITEQNGMIWADYQAVIAAWKGGTL